MQSESAEVSSSPVLPVPAPGLEIHITADQTIGYAAIQNNVPVVRSISILNTGSEAIADIELALQCSPAFAVGVTLKFERLLPGELRNIPLIDLAPNHDYLSKLDEFERAAITATATAQGLSLIHI